MKSLQDMSWSEADTEIRKRRAQRVRDLAGWPEVRALVEAAKNVLDDLGEPAMWKDVCPEHHRQLMDALAQLEALAYDALEEKP